MRENERMRDWDKDNERKTNRGRTREWDCERMKER